jgi:hypothetical protein
VAVIVAALVIVAPRAWLLARTPTTLGCRAFE